MTRRNCKRKGRIIVAAINIILHKEKQEKGGAFVTKLYNIMNMS